jgi:hypothetical protein
MASDDPKLPRAPPHGDKLYVEGEKEAYFRDQDSNDDQDTLTGAKPSSVELPARLYPTLVLVIVIAAALLVRTFLRH